MALYRMFVDVMLELPDDLPPTTETIQLAAREYKKVIRSCKLPSKPCYPGTLTPVLGKPIWSLNDVTTDRAVWLSQHPYVEEIPEC